MSDTDKSQEENVLDVIEPLPLSRFMEGHATIHWRTGSTTRHRMCRQTVERTRLMVSERQGPDRLHWYDDAFLQFDSDDVLLIEWESKPEFGWPTVEEREAQRANGFHGGVLKYLVDYWGDQGGFEPAYSPRAICTIHQAMTDGIDAEGVARLAQRLEGSKGADVLRRVYETLGSASTSGEKPQPSVGVEKQPDDPRPEDDETDAGGQGNDSTDPGHPDPEMPA